MKIGLTNIVSCKIGSTQVNRVYIGSTLIWSYSAFDPDAQLFITNAAITEPVQQSAVNNLVIDLKNYGVWSKMKALYPFVGGTAAQHKFNLKNPLDTDAAFRLVFNGGWTHSSTGSTPNGVNGFANTFFKVSNWTTKDNCHMSYYSRTNVNGPQVEIGLYDVASCNNSLAVRYNDSFQSLLNLAGNSGWLLVANTNSSGQFMANRNAVNTLNSWKNGVKQGQVASTSFTTVFNPTLNYTLGAYNDAGTPAAYSAKQAAFASFGDGLTDTEAANYYTAVQNFQVSLSRQV